MKRSKYNIGEFLYGIPSDKESEKYNPENERVFIHDGYENGDGYGKLIGWHGHKIVKSSGWGNLMWGGDVRLATDEEKEAFMRKVMFQEKIYTY